MSITAPIPAQPTLHDHIRSASARFGEVLVVADPAARVPTCPDWTAADLFWHLAEVQWFWAAIVRSRMQEPERAEASVPQRPDSAEGIAESLQTATDTLLTLLSRRHDDDPVWTWAAQKNVGFVRRFQAHEATMHRLDAELTVGADTGLDPDLAADGVEVVLRNCFGWRPDWAAYSPGAIGRVGGWLVQSGTWGGTSPNTVKTFEAELTLGVVDSGEPVFTLDGDPVVLDRWLWSRGPFDGLQVDGDRDGFEQFAAVIRAGVQ